MEPRQATADRESLGELVGQLTREASDLIRSEVELAKAELRHSARAAARDVALIAGGAAIAYAGVIALVFALAWALARRLPMWESALIAGLVALLLGGLAAWAGVQSLRGEELIPRQTVETLKENARWTRRRRVA
jgi:hypothetical protein